MVVPVTVKKRNSIIAVLWAIAFTGVLSIGYMFLMNTLESIAFAYILMPAVAMTCLGIALIILTARTAIKKILKAFLLLTGSSAAAIMTCAILHNLAYALLLLIAEQGFFNLPEGFDEPVFFIIGLVIAPIGLITGVIGSAVLIHAKKMLRK